MHGTFALCPAAGGARLWDAGIDLRLAFDVVCGADGAGEFPEGDQPLPWAINLSDIPDGLGDLLDDAELLPVLLPLEQCTGVNLPPILRNDAMQRRLDELMTFAHITDEDFFVTNIGYATYVLSDLVRAPDKLDARNPFTTLGVDYSSDPLIQANIPRFVADPIAAAELHQVSDFGGAIGTSKVLSMHTSEDQLVVPGNEDFISNVLPADQRTIAIVDEDTPTHCGFNDAEGLAGWEALRAWKDGAPQPDVDGSAAAMRSDRGGRRRQWTVPVRSERDHRSVRRHRASASARLRRRRPVIRAMQRPIGAPPMRATSEPQVAVPVRAFAR